VVWLAVVVLVVAVLLAVVVGMAAYAAQDRTPPRGASGLHRAGAGRHRPGGLREAAASVAGLRAREHAEAMPMYPTGSRGDRS
jgi:hypothetical protein